MYVYRARSSASFAGHKSVYQYQEGPLTGFFLERVVSFLNHKSIKTCNSTHPNPTSKSTIKGVEGGTWHG